jgi:hypothetical protein
LSRQDRLKAPDRLRLVLIATLNRGRLCSTKESNDLNDVAS